MINMDMVAGIGTGFTAGLLTAYWLMVRPLLHGMVRLRYDGFRPELPPARPKTVPLPAEKLPRED